MLVIFCEIQFNFMRIVQWVLMMKFLTINLILR